MKGVFIVAARLNSQRTFLAVMSVLGLCLLMPLAVRGHCDTMDGPVVVAAKAALEKGEVSGVLKWVKKEHEAEVQATFRKTLAVRAKGPEARELADLYFFETVVRIHRAGEGEPYTGLKPTGTDPGLAVTAADKAMETGSADELVKMVTDKVAVGIRQRCARAAEAKKHMNDSVEAGREYVAAYVDFIHYTDGLYQIAEGRHAEHDAAPTGKAGGCEHERAQAQPDKH
jgi:hypothetical protein